MLAQVQTHLASKLLCKKQPKAVVCHVLLLGEQQLKQIVLLQVSREVRKTWRIMINDWQNMSAYRPRKKIQRQKTTQKIRSSKQRKCTSTSPHTISESQKRESSSKKKLLWLWIRWKMQFCFGRCGSTVIHQKGTFVGKSSSFLSLTLFPKHKIQNYQKNPYFFTPIDNGQNCSVQEVACLIIWLSRYLVMIWPWFWQCYKMRLFYVIFKLKVLLVVVPRSTFESDRIP